MITLYYLMKKSKRDNIHKDQYYSDLCKNKCLKLKELNSKCRVCLQEGSINLCGDNISAEISEALLTFADVQANENDDYPKNLCSTCYDFIKRAILFRKVAKQSEEILKQPIKQETFYEQYDYLSDNSEYDYKYTDKWSGPVSDVKIEKKPKLKDMPKVTCNICSKIINRSYYKQHMTMHDPDHKKYVCDVCGKSFRLRCAYHNHSLRHRSDFTHKCQYCPYRGRYAELLKTHMRTHTGDYRYMCTECPARFLFKSNLNSHMLKHKEPEFKCDACKRAFHTKLKLQRHFEADHLGIKNHVCNLCGKAFGYRNAMMKHQRHVHKREKLLSGRMPSYLEAENRGQDI